MKFRIFVIAHQLNMDTTRLLAYCRLAGIQVKKSALTAISSEQIDRLLAFIKEHPEHPDLPLEMPNSAFLFEEWPFRQRTRYSQLCEKAHRSLIVGVCPWCGRSIIR